MRVYILLFAFILVSIGIFAQDGTFVDTSTATQVDSQVSQHVVAPLNNTPEDLGSIRNKSSNMTLFFVGLAVFLFFGLLRFVYPKYISELIGVLSKSTLGRLTSKDSLWQSEMPRALFIVLYFVCCGFIIGRFIEYFGPFHESGFTFWLWGMSMVLGFSILKRLSIHAVALIFKFTDKANVFFRHRSVVNQVLGFILLPVCGAILLVPNKLCTVLLFIGGSIYAISLIFRLLINIAYVRNIPNVNFFHFIVYLCTLEIIPIAVCARYVYNSIGA